MHVTFPTQTNAQLSGVLEHFQSKTLVIICYGYKSTPDHPAIKIVSNDLNGSGFATFVFKFTSEALAVDIKSQVDDLEAITNHFSGQFNRIVLLASSLGALSASIAAARLPKVNFLITLNGFFGLPQLGLHLRKDYLIFRTLTLLPSTHRGVWRFVKREFQPQNIRARTLVLHCPTDKDVLIAQSQYFYNQLDTQKTFQELDLNDHDISSASDAHKIAATVIKWLDRR